MLQKFTNVFECGFSRENKQWWDSKGDGEEEEATRHGSEGGFVNRTVNWISSQWSDRIENPD